MPQDVSIFQYTYTVLMYFVFIFIWNQLLQPRFKRKTAVMIEIMGCVLYIALAVYANHTFARGNLIRTLTPIIMFLAYVMLLYKTPWYQNALAFVLAFLCMSAPEAFIPSMLMTTEEVMAGVSSLPAARQVILFGLCLFMNAITLSSLCVGWKAVKKERLWAIPGRVWILYLTIPISQVYLILELSSAEAYAPQKTVPIIAILLLCIAANIALLCVINHTADYAVMSMENKIQEQEIKSQKKYFEALTQQYDQTRKMRHDINNHIFTIKALLNAGEIDSAKKYLSSVEETQNLERKTLLCGNMLVSTFLDAKSESMMKSGVQFNCQANLPADIHVTDLDLVTALGNLCDNAQEAAIASKVDKPAVNMTLCIRNGFFSVIVNNPAPEAEQTKERRIPELERGVGSGILRKLAEKYEGEYTIKTENGICNVSLFLKV